MLSGCDFGILCLISGSPRWLEMLKFNCASYVTSLLMDDYYCDVVIIHLVPCKSCSSDAATGNLPH